MKRCPQCEFIYEDDQSHCDMDGSSLTLDSQPLPKLQALTTGSEPLTKSMWRTRVVPITAAVILTSVLGLVYYVSMQSSRRSTDVVISPATETPLNTSEPSPSPVSNAAASPEQNPETDSKTDPEPKAAIDASTTEEKPPSVRGDAKKPEEKSSTKPTSTDRRVKAKQQAQNSAPPAATEKPAEKSDSKVRSMLRKTGRFLKKTLPL